MASAQKCSQIKDDLSQHESGHKEDKRKAFEMGAMTVSIMTLALMTLITTGLKCCTQQNHS